MKKIEYKTIKMSEYSKTPFHVRSKGAFKIDYGNGEHIYKVNAKIHKPDGPSWFSADGRKAWHISNYQITETDFLKTSLVGQELLK